jgi:hypothetical protein
VVPGSGSPTSPPFTGSGSAADTRGALFMGGTFVDRPSSLQSLSQAARLRSVRSASPSPIKVPGGRRIFAAQASVRAASLDPVLGPSPSFVAELDAVMESGDEASASAAASSASDVDPPATPRPSSARQPLPAGLLESPAAVAVRALADKIDASASVSAIGGFISVDFKMTVVDFVKKYHADVVRLGAVATHLGKLRQHKSNGSYPTALQSIREPKIQWSHEFMAAPLKLEGEFLRLRTIFRWVC